MYIITDESGFCVPSPRCFGYLSVRQESQARWPVLLLEADHRFKCAFLLSPFLHPVFSSISENSNWFPGKKGIFTPLEWLPE